MRFAVATPTRPRRRTGLALRGQVQTAVALVAVVLITAGILRSPAYRMPESVGGSVRLLLPADAATESGWRNALADAGMEGDVGLYGANGSPEFLVFAYSDQGSSARGALGKLSSGFGRATGTIVGLSSSNVQTREGAEYACAPFSGGSFSAVCTWADTGYVGSVASINDGQGVTLQRAVQARTALSA
ncbi:MAG: hypothetical protein WD770_08330 [Actinomycetota bacterium]